MVSKTSPSRIEAALERAREAFGGARFERTDERELAPRRWFVVGDPQTTDERFFAVLERRGLLDDDGLLHDDVGLVSVGDHFDFRSELPLDEVGRHGERILAWLCAHPATQVTVLLGNHDLCRVMELWRIDDAAFAEARALALEIHAREQQEARQGELVERFIARFPDVPTPETARRDWSSFSVAQRTRLQALLLEGRVKLATTLSLPLSPSREEREALVTHACVSTRELSALGVSERDGPRAIAAALNEALASGVERARPAWSQRRLAPLSLGGLQHPGAAGKEGGGLLYHRVVNPRADAVLGDGLVDARRRRFPAAELPRGLAQVCGHTAHEKSVQHLAGWVTPVGSALGPGAVRALVVGEGDPRYGPLAIATDARAEDGVVLFVDGKMNDVEPERYELLASAPVSRSA